MRGNCFHKNTQGKFTSWINIKQTPSLCFLHPFSCCFPFDNLVRREEKGERVEEGERWNVECILLEMAGYFGSFRVPESGNLSYAMD